MPEEVDSRIIRLALDEYSKRYPRDSKIDSVKWEAIVRQVKEKK